MPRPSKLAIIVSRFNADVTSGLKSGALQLLKEKGVSADLIDLFEAPGAFEIPLIAQRLARSRNYQGIICLGCVIKGDTAHFEFISMGSTIGIMQAMLGTDVPITFGILTTYDEAQAVSRSREDSENKGREAAQACWETIRVLQSIPATT